MIKATHTLTNKSNLYLVVGNCSEVISRHKTLAEAEDALSKIDISRSRYGGVEVVAPGKTATGNFIQATDDPKDIDINKLFIPAYCTRPDTTCKECSLVSYNRDCQNNPVWGGYRPGSGRPPVDEEELRKNRSIKFSDAEWEQVKKLAEAESLNASEYIRKKALE